MGPSYRWVPEPLTRKPSPETSTISEMLHKADSDGDSASTAAAAEAKGEPIVSALESRWSGADLGPGLTLEGKSVPDRIDILTGGWGFW